MSESVNSGSNRLLPEREDEVRIADASGRSEAERFDLWLLFSDADQLGKERYRLCMFSVLGCRPRAGCRDRQEGAGVEERSV